MVAACQASAASSMLFFQVASIPLCAFLFDAVAVGSIWTWSRRRRSKRRPPFRAEVRLLRLPGETLFGQIQRLEGRIMALAVAGMTVPGLLATGYALLACKGALRYGWPLTVTGIAAGSSILLLAGIAVVVLLIVRNAREMSNRYLGYCGERVVSEHLRPLERRGWVVLHDVPATGSRPFNLDHVAIGPGGVFVIETKAPRKYASAPSPGHRLAFDGRAIVWPDGRHDTAVIDRALSRSRWLSDRLFDVLGERVEVRSILAFVDWFVDERQPARSDLRVINPKLLLRTILRVPPDRLSGRQVSLYGRQIAEWCRTVTL